MSNEANHKVAKVNTWDLLNTLKIFKGIIDKPRKVNPKQAEAAPLRTRIDQTARDNVHVALSTAGCLELTARSDDHNSYLYAEVDAEYAGEPGEIVVSYTGLVAALGCIGRATDAVNLEIAGDILTTTAADNPAKTIECLPAWAVPTIPQCRTFPTSTP